MQDRTLVSSPADAAEDAATALARAVGACVEHHIIVDDEIHHCMATLVSWAKWLKHGSLRNAANQPLIK
jgi:hypothetical protein